MNWRMHPRLLLSKLAGASSVSGCSQCQRCLGNVAGILPARPTDVRAGLRRSHVALRIYSPVQQSCWRLTALRAISLTCQNGAADLPSSASVTFGAADAATATSGFLPPPPDIPGLVDQLTILGEPTLASLGLGGYWPAGWVQSFLESIHVYMDLPWFGSIIMLTVVIRCLSLPITLMQLKNAAMMNNHMPTIQKLQVQQMEAARAKDHGRVERLSAEFNDYMKRNNCHPLKMMLRPLIAAPIFISVFSGLRGMTNLPVQSLITGGGVWFPDLTIADPYYVLPALSAITVYAVTKTGAEGVSMSTMPPEMRLFMNVLPIGLFAFISFQPSALALYWTTSNVLSLIFSKAFRTPYARKLFDIPEMVVHPQVEKTTPSTSMNATMKEYARISQLSHEINDRKKVGAVVFDQKDPESKNKTSTPATPFGSKSYDPSQPRLNRQQFKNNPIEPAEPINRKSDS